MTILNTRNNNTDDQIKALNEQFIQMQQALADMQTQMRLLNQQHKAQETFTKEWENSIKKNLIKAFKDSCSVYGTPEVIDELLEELKKEGEEIKKDFETYAESDRYLNQVTAEIEDEQDEPEVIEATPVLTSTMPDKEDNETILIPEQIKNVIEGLDVEILNQLKRTFDISNKISKVSTIATALAKKQLTYYRLRKIIDNLQGQQLLLAGI